MCAVERVAFQIKVHLISCIVASVTSVKNHSQSLEVLMPEDRLYYKDIKPSWSAEQQLGQFSHILFIQFP